MKTITNSVVATLIATAIIAAATHRQAAADLQARLRHWIAESWGHLEPRFWIATAVLITLTVIWMVVREIRSSANPTLWAFEFGLPSGPAMLGFGAILSAAIAETLHLNDRDSPWALLPAALVLYLLIQGWQRLRRAIVRWGEPSSLL